MCKIVAEGNGISKPETMSRTLEMGNDGQHPAAFQQVLNR